MNKTAIFAAISLTAGLVLGAAACSGGTETANNASGATNANKLAANTAALTNTGGNHSGSADDMPSAVRAVFPDARSFTKQHKDIPKDAAANIEKETGGKIPDTDHHSYLAFSTTGGGRKQIGAATVVKANGKEIIIVYDNKEGSPIIREIRAGDGLPIPFITQFAGKGHDDKFQIGADLKANGVDGAAAKAIAQAIRIDVMTMQALYGAAHSH